MNKVGSRPLGTHTSPNEALGQVHEKLSLSIEEWNDEWKDPRITMRSRK